MIVLYITAQLRAPWVHSLKEKRALLRPLMHQLRTQHNLAVAESGRQDVHTLLELTLAQLAFNAAQAESIQQTLYDDVVSATDAELIAWEVEYR